LCEAHQDKFFGAKIIDGAGGGKPDKILEAPMQASFILGLHVYVHL